MKWKTLKCKYLNRIKATPVVEDMFIIPSTHTLLLDVALSKAIPTKYVNIVVQGKKKVGLKPMKTAQLHSFSLTLTNGGYKQLCSKTLMDIVGKDRVKVVEEKGVFVLTK